MNKRKWVTLGIIGTALLLLPRRSSWQSNLETDDEAKKEDVTTKDSENKGLNVQRSNR